MVHIAYPHSIQPLEMFDIATITLFTTTVIESLDNKLPIDYYFLGDHHPGHSGLGSSGVAAERYGYTRTQHADT